MPTGRSSLPVEIESEMPTQFTQDGLARLEARRTELKQMATELLESRQAQGVEQLSDADAIRFRAMRRDLRDLNHDITEYRADLERSGIPDRYANLGGSRRAVNTAGRLSPLGYGDEQLRRAFDQVNRGETAVLEQRNPGFTSATTLIPPDLAILPVFPRHEGRLLDKLPGVAIDVPAIAYIEVVSTTGTAAVVAEGAAKPELLMPATAQQATARTIAAHVGVSWQAYSGDYPAFVSAVQTELMRAIVDAENLQLFAGTGEANGQVNGLTTNANILTFAATGVGTNAEHWSDLLGAIAALRTGPALAEPDLLLLHPNTWAALRGEQDLYGRFYVAADPSTDQVDQAWGIDVLTSTQFTAGIGVLFDTTQYGRAVIREPIITRIGYSGTDFTQNVVRFLSETRLTQTIERPQSICKITGLPTAAPAKTKK
jgi:HK97 family phage major capsid protein